MPNGDEAPSLIDLARGRTQIAVPTQGPPTPTQIKQIGDEVLASATAIANEETVGDQLFIRSLPILRNKLKADEPFARRVLPKLARITGRELVEQIILAADEVKLENLRQTQPEWFKSESAAKLGFFDTALFGQLSRIGGTWGALLPDDMISPEFQGKTRGEITEILGERARLLEQEFPGSNIVGQTAAFMVPGSPVKKLFESVAKLGASGAAKAITKAGLKRGVIRSAIATGVGTTGGAVAVTGIPGTIGRDTEDVNLDRGLSDALAVSIPSFGIGALFPIVGAAARRTGRFVGRLTEEATGIPEASTRLRGIRESTIREAGGTRAALKAAAGTEAEQGQNLVRFLESQRARFPERASADRILSALPEVDVSMMVNRLTGFPKSKNPRLDSQIELLKEWGTRAKEIFKNPKKANALEVRRWLDDVGLEVSSQFGNPDAAFLSKRLAEAYGSGRRAINKMAAQQGVKGQTYINLMTNVAKKRSTVSFIRRQLGRTPDIQAQRAEGFITRLLGKNKNMQIKKMEQLDQLYGTNFVENARLSQAARQQGIRGAGEEGGSILSTFTTGRSTLGAVLGVAGGGAIGALTGGENRAQGAAFGAALGAGLSTPIGSRLLLGASDKITGFWRRVAQNQRHLLSIQRSGRNPPVVREMALRLRQEFSNEGPVSGGSMMRIMADSPFFIGLVSAFEIADRASRERESAQTARRLGASRVGGRQ